MARPDLPRGAWWLPAVLWAVGSVVVFVVGFGVATACTTGRPEAECSAIGDWAVFGVIAAGLMAVLPTSRAVRELGVPDAVLDDRWRANELGLRRLMAERAALVGVAAPTPSATTAPSSSPPANAHPTSPSTNTPKLTRTRLHDLIASA